MVIYYSCHNGFVQIFFAPPRLNTSTSAGKEILMSYFLNMDQLTPEYVVKLIKQFLVFARVESSLERKYWHERFRVRWWRFVDARNRQAMKGEIDTMWTPWEKLVVVSIFGAVTYILGVFTSDQFNSWLDALKPFL